MRLAIAQVQDAMATVDQSISSNAGCKRKAVSMDGRFTQVEQDRDAETWASPQPSVAASHRPCLGRL